MDRLLQSRLAARAKILKDEAGVGAYLASGPPRKYPDEAALYKDLAGIWANSSLLIHGISRAKGIAYFHFLQPNQYVRGTKELNSEERRTVFLTASPFKEGAEKGYPYLIAAGRALADAGVSFHDRTKLFAGITETIYVDDCCHYNRKGYRLLASDVARIVAGRYRPRAR